jgi:hypothetical protein
MNVWHTSNTCQNQWDGSYFLETPHACASKFVTDGRFSSQGHLASVCQTLPLIDVDSELLGITRKLGSCPESKYKPGSTPFCKLKHMVDERLNNQFASEDCRMSNPAYASWYRMEPLGMAMRGPTTPSDRTIRTYRQLPYDRQDNHRPCGDSQHG